MMRSRLLYLHAMGSLALWLLPATAMSADTDPNATWPLCGRIADNPPAAWTASDGCPPARHGDPAWSDEPLSSTFGPRPLASGNNRYDFHRGVDIATPTGTPFFAIADGVVRIAGIHASYSDPLVSVRHYRPGETSCSAKGCYESLYLHISDWVVSTGQTVTRGQLLGFTGASGDSGFEHLHFEVRDAPAFDPFSSWSRDAIHPLSVVRYAAPNDTTIVFNALDLGHAEGSRADLTVRSNRFDLVSVDLVLLDRNLEPVSQDGAAPDAKGYYVLPPFFDLEATNFLYTHKDSANFPWESFDAGGVNECPYHAEHGAAYAAGVHLDEQDPADYHVGLFNGVRVTTAKYWPSDVHDYQVQLEFLALQGPAACVEATARFASGETHTARGGACTPTPPPPAIELALSTNGKRNQVMLAWTGASGSRVDIHRNGALFTTTRNDGAWNDRAVSRGNTYRYRVCEAGSASACSAEATITL